MSEASPGRSPRTEQRETNPGGSPRTERSDADGIPTKTIDTLIGCWRALSDVCADLTEAEWKRATDLPAWTVQDNVSHIIGTERLLEGLPAAPAHAPELAHVRNPIGDFNENEVEARRDRAGFEVLDEWNDLRRQREQTLMDGDGEYFAQPMTLPTGPGTMADFLAVRILDCWLHEQDIRRALDRPGRLDGDAAEHTIDRLVRTIPMVVAKRAACPEGRAVALHVTGPVERALVCEVRDGRAAFVDDPATEPLCTLTMPTETFVVLATGRRSAAAVADSVTIDASMNEGRDVGGRVIDRFNMMI